MSALGRPHANDSSHEPWTTFVVYPLKGSPPKILFVPLQVPPNPNLVHSSYEPLFKLLRWMEEILHQLETQIAVVTGI